MLFRQTLLYLPAQVVGPLAQVAAAVVWTHWLAPAPYGLLTLLIASQDLLFLVFQSWWTQYTLRYFAGLGSGERASFLLSEASIAILTFAAQTIAVLLILGLLHAQITPALAIATVAYAGTRSLLTHLGERARSQSRIATYTIASFAGSIIGFALAYLAVAVVAPTTAAILGGYAAAQVLGICVLWRRLGIPLGAAMPTRSVMRAALLYGTPLLLAGGAAWLAQNGIRIVVERMAGADALGLLAVGWGLGQRLAATLAMLVIAASFPLAVQTLHAGSRDDGYRQISLAGLMLTALILPASVGISLLARPLVDTFIAAPFREVTIAVLPYSAAFGALRNIRMHIAEPVFLLIERPEMTTATNAVDAALILVGCLAGLAVGGVVGAAAGCLVGTAVSFIVGFALARRIAGYAFPMRDGGKIVAATAIMALALVAVPWTVLGLNAIGRILAEAAAGALVYAAMLAILFPATLPTLRRRLGEVYRVGVGVPLR